MTKWWLAFEQKLDKIINPLLEKTYVLVIILVICFLIVCHMVYRFIFLGEWATHATVSGFATVIAILHIWIRDYFRKRKDKPESKNWRD